MKLLYKLVKWYFEKFLGRLGLPSHNEQLSLTIWWVDNHYTIHEDTLGLVRLENTKANTLFSVIKDILIRCSLPMAQCRGQAYDEASNMSGIQNGVQTLVKKEANQALYVHCLANKLVHPRSV